MYAKSDVSPPGEGFEQVVKLASEVLRDRGWSEEAIKVILDRPPGARPDFDDAIAHGDASPTGKN